MTDPKSGAMLRCQRCHANYSVQQPLWACPCGGILDLDIPARFPWQMMRSRPPGLWRYRDVLPLAHSTVPVSLGEPETPLLDVPNAGSTLYLKLDYLFSTGSFKARGAAVLLSKVRELGVSSVLEDSSGNAGAAIAAYAAAADVEAIIYAPDSASPGKLAQIMQYGAQLVRVPGPRSETTAAALERATQGTYYASHIWNPFFLAGTMTVAFELWDQLGHRVPDWVIAPVGHGTMLLGLALGFEHLRRSGLIGQLPRLAGVQAAACAPLYASFIAGVQSGQYTLPNIDAQPTRADGIAISQPVRWRQILEAIKETGGTMLAVQESEIGASQCRWARRGLLMEPTSATALAAYNLLVESGSIAPMHTVVVVITGSGIKDA